MGKGHRLAVALACGALFAAPTTALARRPPQVVPAKGRKAARAAAKRADLSEGGQRRGGIEFALGSVAAVVTGVLIGRGTWELRRAAEADRLCNSGGAGSLSCGLGGVSGTGSRVAGGLSLAFAVPVAVASGLLFRRGVRVHRHYRRFHAQVAGASVMPLLGRDGTGLAVGLRLAF